MSKEMRVFIDKMKSHKKINETKETGGETEKFFSITDKTGRGHKSYKFPESYIRKVWDLSDEDIYTKETLKDFLDRCYIGDTWETSSAKFECISIK